MKIDYVPVTKEEQAANQSEFVEKYWTKVWDERDLKSSVSRELERREEYKLIDPHISSLPKGSAILDGGCGMGEWTVYYSLRGFRTVGLDISRVTVARLHRRFPEQEFMVGDIRHIGIKDNTVSAYFSWGTFEHFEEGMESCFQEAKRVLEPGGLLFITVPFYNLRHRRNDRKNPPGPVDRTTMRFYQRRLTQEELTKEFERGGFSLLTTEPINKWQGLRRMLIHDFSIPTSSVFHRPIQLLLSPFVPKQYVAHMVIGIGRLKD